MTRRIIIHEGAILVVAVTVAAPVLLLLLSELNFKHDRLEHL